MIRSVDYTLKYVIVGNSSVGKSALLSRFVDNDFNPFFLSTIGVDFKFRTLDIQGKKCKVQIWDTAGQQNFRAIISTYYNGADAIIITYDLTSNQSFEVQLGIIRDLVSYWMGEALNNKGPRTKIMIIATKCDLEDKKVVDDQRVKNFLTKNNIDLWFKTSSKTGEGVDQCFIQLTKRVIQTKNIPSSQNTKLIITSSQTKTSKIKQMCCH